MSILEDNRVNFSTRHPNWWAFVTRINILDFQQKTGRIDKHISNNKIFHIVQELNILDRHVFFSCYTRFQ